MPTPRIEFTASEVKKWKKALTGMSMRDRVKKTGVGETSLRNAINHCWGSEETRTKLNNLKK